MGSIRVRSHKRRPWRLEGKNIITGEWSVISTFKAKKTAEKGRRELLEFRRQNFPAFRPFHYRYRIRRPK